MTHDVETLRLFIRWFLDVAAFFTTLFVVMYSFSPWYSSHLGRAVMLQAISLAMALDMTVLFQYWTPKNVLTAFWMQVIVFALISIGAVYKCWVLWRLNYRKKENLNGSTRRP